MKPTTTLLLTTAVLLGASDVAVAGLQSNGPQHNGIQLNGIQLNGIQLNGIQLNGIQLNGIQLNGIQLNGIQLNGSSLSGSFIGVNSTCFHREDVTGAALPSSCSPCARAVVAGDAYCGAFQWDSLCVQEAKSWCVLEGSELDDQELTAGFDDGSWAKVRINAVSTGAEAQWNGTQYLDMRDVNYYTLAYTCPHTALVTGVKMPRSCSSTVDAVCSADSYCCNTEWDSICVGAANTVTAANKKARGAAGAVCGMKLNPFTKLGTPRRGVFVPGQWNYDSGYAGAGGKSSSTGMTFACESIGAIAKCVHMGYKPWVSSSHNKLHQACVRMVRADYCGNGLAWTEDGTTIDVDDYLGKQSWNDNWLGTDFVYDAIWSTAGATNVNWSDLVTNNGRRTTLANGAVVTLQEYQKYGIDSCPFGNDNTVPSQELSASTGRLIRNLVKR